MFMILGMGCLVDIDRRSPDSPDAEFYHTLGRACLCETSVMEDPDVETITALFYEIWYLLVFSDRKKAAGYAWGLMGLTAKLAQCVSCRFLLTTHNSSILIFPDRAAYVFRLAPSSKPNYL
jgi:hypothetical protein